MMLNPVLYVLTAQGKRYEIIIEQFYESNQVERFRVYNAHNPAAYLVIENNRPVIRKKYQLKKRRYNWKILEGEFRYASRLADLFDFLMNELEPPAPNIRM